MGKQRIFDIELLDTVTHRIIKSGTNNGYFPKEALKKFAKSTNPPINFAEMRDEKYGRYAFLWKERKK